MIKTGVKNKWNIQWEGQRMIIKEYISIYDKIFQTKPGY